MNIILKLPYLFAAFTAVIGQDAPNNICTTLADYALLDISPNCYYDPDVGASPGDIINRHGYPYESYEVTTEDDYNLRLMRIPKVGAPPVLLLNGLLLNSLSWLDIGNQSLAFILSDAGYDVWLGNYRGTIYSANNVEDDLSNADYWNFSFYELGYYDIPAFTEFISTTSTSNEKIIYIGHSMGTLSSYVYAITRSDHANEHLRALISLAPVAFITNNNPVVQLLSLLGDLITAILNALGLHSIGYYNNEQKDWFDVLCFYGPLQAPCVSVYQEIVTLLRDYVAPESLPLLASQVPTGTAVKNLNHFGQLIKSNKFQNYDYGFAGNILRYGSPTPQQFDISQIILPVYLYYGKSDYLAKEEDVLRFYDALTTTKNITEVSVDGSEPFTHLDFIINRAKAPLLYRPLLEQLSAL